jgi:hypothetical protein
MQGSYCFAGSDVSLKKVSIKTVTIQEEVEQGFRLLPSNNLSSDALTLKKCADRGSASSRFRTTFCVVLRREVLSLNDLPRNERSSTFTQIILPYL